MTWEQWQGLYNSLGITLLTFLLGYNFRTLTTRPTIMAFVRVFVVGIIAIASYVWMNELTFGQRCSKVYKDQIEHADCVQRLQKDEPLNKEKT